MIEFRRGQRFKVRNPATGDVLRIRIVDRTPGWLHCDTSCGPQWYAIRVIRQALLGESVSECDDTGCEVVRPFAGMASPLVFASCFERRTHSKQARGILGFGG